MMISDSVVGKLKTTEGKEKNGGSEEHTVLVQLSAWDWVRSPSLHLRENFLHLLNSLASIIGNSSLPVD